MTFKRTSIFAVAAGTSAAAFAGMPIAAADDGSSCDSTAMSSVCQSPGNAEIVATPPDVGGGFLNGPYGPMGNIPPVGGI